MSYFVITKVRVNPQGNVTGALVHELTGVPSGKATVAPGEDVEMSSAELADRLVAGDQAYVGTPSLEKNLYDLSDEVRSSDDDKPFLESFGENGETSTALTDLPRLDQ